MKILDILRSRAKLQTYQIVVAACSTSGCAQIGPAEGNLANSAGILCLLVSVGFGITGFAVSGENRKSQIDTICGVILFVGLCFLLIG